MGGHAVRCDDHDSVSATRSAHPGSFQPSPKHPEPVRLAAQITSIQALLQYLLEDLLCRAERRIFRVKLIAVCNRECRRVDPAGHRLWHGAVVPGLPGHTGEVTSKYDRYWAASLGQIQAALGRAAGGSPGRGRYPGLRDLGDRQSWYGLAEVRGSKLIRSSMAHATSLGKTVATSGICTPWPQDAFRLTVSTVGDLITIAGPASQAASTTPHRQPHRAPVAPAGELPPAPAVRTGPAPARVMAGRAGSEEFYRLLAGLAGGARRLQDCRPGDCPRAGSTSSSKTARSATTAAAAWCGSARTC